MCIKLKSDWIRGYIHKGYAEYYLGKLEDAKLTYTKGL